VFVVSAKQGIRQHARSWPVAFTHSRMYRSQFSSMCVGHAQAVIVRTALERESECECIASGEKSTAVVRIKMSSPIRVVGLRSGLYLAECLIA
jgi:hypothetical protein